MWNGLLILLVANFINGALNPLFVKIGLREFPPITFTLLRFLIATIVFLPIYIASKPERLGKKDIKVLLAQSVFFAINVTLYGIGLQYTNVIVSQILYTSVPIFTGVFAHYLVGEKFTKNKIIGAAIAFIGVIFLIQQSMKGADVSFGTVHGNLIILVGVICWSLYMAFSKRLTNKYSPATTSFVSYVETFLLLLLFVPFELYARPFELSHISSIGVLSLLGVGIISSALSSFLIQWGIKKTSAFTASLFFYMAPLFASVTAIPILHEKVTVNLVIGGLLIVGGVFLATTFESLVKRK